MQDKFTEEEYLHLKIQMKRVGSHLPEDMAGLVWNSYLKITDTRESVPCTCGKNGSLWAKAVGVVNDYIKQNG